MPAISAAAQANEDILVRLRDADQPAAVAELATLRPDVRPDSFKRTLVRLADDGLVTIDGADTVTLTEQGDRVLLALEIAGGRVAPGPFYDAPAQAPADRWPLDRCYPNPDNPARPVDEERDANFRESIVQAGDLLQPVALSPPDASGARMIWIGHRRWEACRILREEGRLPTALAEGLPFREWKSGPDQADHRVEALRLALMENAQRADVPPWEDAKLLARYAELTGKPARQVAFDLGRAQPGRETGVKDVQEKIKVVRKATPEAIARHEAGAIRWEDLRGTVRTKAEPGDDDAPKTDLSPKQLLALVEAYDYAARRGVTPGKAGEVPILRPADHGGDYGLVHAARLGFNTGGGGQFLMVFAKVWEELERLGHIYRPDEAEEARAERLLNLRGSVVSFSKALACDREGTYVTGWLNLPLSTPAHAEVTFIEGPVDSTPPPPSKGVIDPDNELIVDGRHFPNLTLRNEYLRRLRGEGGAGSPAKPKEADAPAAITITPSQRLAMFELARKIATTDQTMASLPGGASYAVPIGRYWLSRDFAELKAEPGALIVHVHNAQTEGRPYAALTGPGLDWLDSEGFHDDPKGLLALARAQAGVTPPEDGGWNTEWLNIDTPESAALETEADEDDSADPSPAKSGEGGPRSGSDEGSAGGGWEIDPEKDRIATAILQASGALPPAPVLQTLSPEAQALADLWLKGGELFALDVRMDLAGDADVEPVDDHAYRHTLHAFQMALWAASAHVPKAIRDNRPPQEPPPAPLLTLSIGDEVFTASGKIYRLLGPGQTLGRPGEGIDLWAQRVKDGQLVGQPGNLPLANIWCMAADAPEGHGE